MAAMAVASENSSQEGRSSFQIKPSPSKKVKMESTENSDDDEDYDPVADDATNSEHSEELDIKLKSEPGTRSRKRPQVAVICRLGDVLGGLLPVHKASSVEEGSRSSSSLSGAGSSDKPQSKYEVETDPAVLARRRKQISYGKNTVEYQTYSKAVPRECREPFHPRTPNAKRKYSRRAWDGLIKQWRKKLHIWHDHTINGVTDQPGPFSENESFTSEEPEDRKIPISELVQEFENEGNGDADAVNGPPNLKTEIKQQEPSGSTPQMKIEKCETSWSQEVDEYYDEDSEDDNIRVKV